MVKRVKARARPNVKRQAKPREWSDKLLARVPADCVFWCHDGRVFADMKEMADGLAAMSDDTFAHHSNPDKRDFSNWVRDVIKDEQLASDLAMATGRLQAAGHVAARVAFLTGKAIQATGSIPNKSEAIDRDPSSN